ncbi:MAG: hypothetical protein WDO14_22140 [Bacteroidota bacterium]
MRPRRIVATFFLALILCQIGGYYGVLEFVKNQMSDHTAQRIIAENAPIGGQLILQIPFASKELNAKEYYVGNSYFSFERNIYHVIERHVYKDILYVVCMRNDEVTDAQQTIESLVQSLSGKPGEEGTGVKFFENLSKYFFSEQYSSKTIAAGWMAEQPFGVLEPLYHHLQPAQLFRPPRIS